MAQLPANAAGMPAPSSSAATELVASSNCKRGPLARGASRIHPPHPQARQPARWPTDAIKATQTEGFFSDKVNFLINADILQKVGPPDSAIWSNARGNRFPHTASRCGRSA
jgi:hypothetical protein